MKDGGLLASIACLTIMMSLKSRREDILFANPTYRSIHEKVESPGVLLRLFEEETQRRYPSRGAGWRALLY